ncbi:unnamed protein product, partial [Durusdinium trenchii]
GGNATKIQPQHGFCGWLLAKMSGDTGEIIERSKSRKITRLSLKDNPLVLLPAVLDEGVTAETPRSQRFPAAETEAAEQKTVPHQPKKTRVPPLSYERFRRNKEREQQSAAVYDIKSARSGVLQSLRLGSPDDAASEMDFPFSNIFASTEASELQRPSSGHSISRPGTRQSARYREAQQKLLEAKEDLDLEEDNDETILSVAQREQLKQEYWQDYNEAGSAKKTLSEFEEWQRVLHGRTEASTTASDWEDGGLSRLSVEDTDWRISHLGFTRRSDQEEYISDYYQRCRRRHCIPLGPRGTKGNSQESRPSVDPVAVKPGVMHFGGWSLGSERLEMLCQAPGAVEHCRRCDLSKNRIEDRSVSVICDKILPRAEALNLSSNFIGQLGIRHFEASLRKITMSPLLELNLQGNRLGTPFGPSVEAADAYERDLCNFVDALSTRTPELRALSLAQNGLGRVNHDLGKALGSMITELKHLRVLDLHWNSFHGLGAYKLIEGIGENRLSGGATLSRVDLSWNRMGMACAKSHNPSKMLAEVLVSNDKLFHLDISYNAIGTEDCMLIANGLRYNNTLFGFHVAGNEAFVDELGFLMPLSDPCRLRLAGIDMKDDQEATGQDVKSAWSASEAASQVFGREVQHPSFPVAEGGGKTIRWDGKRRVSKPKVKPTKCPPRRTYPLQKQKSLYDAAPRPAVPWEDWQESEYSMPLAQAFQRSNLEEVTCRAERCWICDRYRPVKIMWTPAISSQLNEDEVGFVHAYVSSDDFLRPTCLKRIKSEKQAARFVGYRMVPKLKEALLIIFRVNGVIEAANDMPIRFLPCPAKVAPLSEDDLTVIKKNEGAEALANVQLPSLDKSNAETRWANELVLEDTPMPVIVTEDAVAEGKLEVYPRRVDKVAQVVEYEWDKSQSVFASWRVASESIFEKMLAMDLKFCRIQKFAPDQDERQLKKLMLPIYPKLVSIYRKMSCWSDKHQVFGVSLHNVQSLLQRGHVFDRHMQADHLPSMAYASHVIERRFAEEITVYSDNYLIRYQFMETLMRVAEAKYLRFNKTDSLGEAMKLLCNHFDSEMTPIFEEEQQFLDSLFTEEVDFVFKNNLNLLNAAYNIYAGITDVPDNHPYAPDQLRGKRKVTLPDFCELLDDCDLFDQRFLRSHTARVFAMGCMYNVDEVGSCNHMRLNFVEFLVALGAVVFRKESYSPEEFADLLEELLLDQLKPVVLDFRSRNGSKDEIEGLLTHKALRQICKSIFEMADEDGGQTLSSLEFGNALRDPRTKELFKGKEFPVSEILRAFGALDEDGSGELNFNEVLHGIGALLKVEQNEPRVRAFLRKELNNEDGKGQFTANVLLTFLNKGSTQRKFMRVGIEMSELTELVLDSLEIPRGTRNADRLREGLDTMFSSESSTAQREEAVRDFRGTITAMRQEHTLFSSSDFMERVLRLRKPTPIPRWKILFKQIFEQADLDRCGTLTKEEFTAALESPQTQARLESLGLDLDLVEEMFEVIDVDGSDDVTEAELLLGVELLLELQKECRPSECHRPGHLPRQKDADL